MILSKRQNLLTAIILGILFFTIGVFTLPDYGINWDTINHLPRGQAYLHYFLTGNKDYSDLAAYKPYWQKPESLGIDTNISKDSAPTRSYYQSDAADFNWFKENGDGGHPPLSDILSSVFNRVFFGKLGIINDIDAYRVYSIFLAACLVGLIFYWVSDNFGTVAGFISAMSLALYPVFWSESHFNNEKDIPETVFWSFLIYCVWKGFITKKSRWILLAGVFFGLALGTKFNVLFVSLVIAPWLLFYWLGRYFPRFNFNKLLRGKPRSIPSDKLVHSFASSSWQATRYSQSLNKFMGDNAKLLVTAIGAIFLGIIIFIGSWPYLWPDPIAGLISVISFYKGIGLTQNVDPRFLGPLGTNTYALYWITATSPPMVLCLSILGIIVSTARIFKGKNDIFLLFLLWLIIPIARVTWPGTTIYGGIRQIMEYVPAMAIFTGVGGGFLFELIQKLNIKMQNYRLKLKNNINRLFLIFKMSFLFLVFTLLIYPVVQYHPNENVYFNFLIGGLRGAKDKDIPSWGNSFGAAYRQGVVWMNNNLPRDAKIAYARELLPNIPMLWLRQDLTLHNSYRSGYLRKGEYVIALVYQGVEKTSYFDRYLDRVLEPIYEVKADGVAILKIWKSDAAHTRKGYLSEGEVQNVKISTNGNTVTFSFDKIIYLSRLTASYDETIACKELSSAYVQISGDGNKWETLPGNMPREDWNTPQIGAQPQNGKFTIPFAADKAKYLRIVSDPINSCLINIRNLKIYYFDELG